VGILPALNVPEEARLFIADSVREAEAAHAKVEAAYMAHAASLTTVIKVASDELSRVHTVLSPRTLMVIGLDAVYPDLKTTTRRYQQFLDEHVFEKGSNGTQLNQKVRELRASLGCVDSEKILLADLQTCYSRLSRDIHFSLFPGNGWACGGSTANCANAIAITLLQALVPRTMPSVIKYLDARLETKRQISAGVVVQIDNSDK
jgi:hypothetical protein